MINGVGINDANYEVQIYEKTTDGRRVVWRCPYYSKWVSMISRCYSEKGLERNKSYENCSICGEWLTFSNFKSWMEKQDWEGKELDKDLYSFLLKEGKVYSPETCIFLDPWVNVLLSSMNKVKEGLPKGVSVHKQSGRYRVRSNCIITKKYKHLGMYDDIESAVIAYNTFRVEQIKQRMAEIEDQELRDCVMFYFEHNKNNFNNT